MEAFGERLHLARKMRLHSLRSLATAVGISHTQLRKLENGAASPDSRTYMALVEALKVPADFFLAGPALRRSDLRYRARSRVGARQRESIGAQFDHCLDRYAAVERLVPGLPPFSPPDVDVRVHSLADAERAADQLRTAWDLGSDPIDSVTAVLEDWHVWVVLLDTAAAGIEQGGFDGVCCWVEDRQPAVAVSKGCPGDRQRLSLCHELAHVLLRPDADLDEEKVAMRFAGAFLAPAVAVHREFPVAGSAIDNRELYVVKHKYGLSMQAWLFRLRDTGVITDSAFDRHWRNFSSRGWRSSEPGDRVAEEEPSRMRQLVYRALANETITRSRAVELLNLQTMSELDL